MVVIAQILLWLSMFIISKQVIISELLLSNAFDQTQLASFNDQICRYYLLLSNNTSVQRDGIYIFLFSEIVLMKLLTILLSRLLLLDQKVKLFRMIFSIVLFPPPTQLCMYYYLGIWWSVEL